MAKRDKRTTKGEMSDLTRDSTCSLSPLALACQKSGLLLRTTLTRCLQRQ